MHVKFTKKAATKLCRNIKLTVTEQFDSNRVLYDQVITKFATFTDNCQVNILNYEGDPVGIQVNRNYEFKISGDQIKERV